MTMTKTETDALITGIERTLANAHSIAATPQVLIVHKSEQPARWMFSCSQCNAHGDDLPLEHEESCPYYDG